MKTIQCQNHALPEMVKMLLEGEAAIDTTKDSYSRLACWLAELEEYRRADYTIKVALADVARVTEKYYTIEDCGRGIVPGIYCRKRKGHHGTCSALHSPACGCSYCLGIEPCFSCEKLAQKYNTGLCEECHRIAKEADKHGAPDRT